MSRNKAALCEKKNKKHNTSNRHIETLLSVKNCHPIPN